MTEPQTRPELRLLIVEDSANDAELDALELRRAGYDVDYMRVDTPDDLAEALEHSWDLVLCDYGLPSFTAQEALRMVRANDEYTPFVILSGTIGEEAAVEALKAGARDVVIKTNLGRLGTVAEREVRDARARRRHHAAELELERSEARHRAILDATLDGVLAVEADGHILDANPACATIFRQPIAQLVGRPIDDLVPIAPLSAEPSRLEVEALRADGSTFPAEVAVSSGELSAGRFWIVYVRDLTERAEAEAANRALQAQLAQVQKLEAVGRLAAGIAHDFNNIIAVVNGYSALALSETDADSSVGGSLRAIRDAGARARMLTKQLLAFTRQQVLEPERIDLGRLVGEMWPMLSLVGNSDLELRTELASDLWPVLADPSQIEQVIMNLVVNAVDAMPGGGALTFATENVDESPGDPTVPAGRYVALTITDTGTGIDDETQKHIFDPFFSTKAPGEGTGLGLATVYGIVRQSGGAIRVRSRPGAGSAFSIYLPVAGDG